MKTTAKAVVLLFLGASILVLSGFLGTPANGDEPGEKPAIAPVSGRFLRFMNQVRTTGRPRIQANGRYLGLVPSVHDIQSPAAESLIQAAALPSSFDLRTLNKLTPVRDQGQCGSCWAFACYGSLESYLMPTENRDYSEQDLIDHHGFDWAPCDGGNIDLATAYLARWDGPVNETDDPYVHAALAAGRLPIRKHVQNVIYLPARSGPLDNGRIKQAVMSSGGVAVAMSFGDGADLYNSSNSAYYDPATNDEINHLVVIAGWDDQFDRNRFRIVPPGDGAFLVKNSWGASWGRSGYFYVSYYDGVFARSQYSAAYTAEPATENEKVYQYDPLGWTLSFGNDHPSDSAWGANIFTADSDLPLNAVSFYNTGNTNSYEIYVYKNSSPGGPRTGLLSARKIGTIGDPGYYTIPLDSTVPLIQGQRFSVVVKFTTRGSHYPVPAEYPIEDYSGGATASAGQSFFSTDGLSWSDLHGFADPDLARTNVCIKAFAGYPGVYPPAGLALERLENNLIFSVESINRLGWSINAKNTTSIRAFRLYRKANGSDDSHYQFITELDAAIVTYDDRGLKPGDSYTYGISCVDDLSRESEMAEISNEES
jgi:C1A family cysteine protease